jgi:hypothetical protein
MKLQLFRSALLLVLVGIPALASAGETIPQEGIWSKVGIGAASTAYAAVATISDGSEVTLSASGVAPELRAAIGTVISPGNVLHASLGINRLAEPELKATGSGAEFTQQSTRTLSLLSACAGFTHYFGSASISARGGYASQSDDEDSDGSSGWISGAGLDYDFSASESSRFGVGLNIDYAELDYESGDSQSYASFGLFLNGTFY